MAITRPSVAVTCSVFLSLAAAAFPQQVPTAVISDPPPNANNPARMESPDVPSHGSKMYTVLYVAAGAGPHPTVVLMHGFPGNEKNLDLAYSIRRAGWNVLVPFCRGAWGSPGTFSFTHAIEDTQAAIEFLRSPENVKKYLIDPNRIVLMGHSVGGFIVASAAAQDAKIYGVAMISASNLGPGVARQRLRDPQELMGRWRANASRLLGTSVEALLEEVGRNPEGWNYLNFVPRLENRPLLIVEAQDPNVNDNKALAEALRKAGDTRVTEREMLTDHSFSDHRIALQAALIMWLQELGSASDGTSVP